MGYITLFSTIYYLLTAICHQLSAICYLLFCYLFPISVERNAFLTSLNRLAGV
jgi:hypothetical protein